MKHKIFLMLALAGLYSFGVAEVKKTLPYQDPNLSAEVRAKDLLSRLTLEQKVTLMMNDSHAIPELGIQEYNWWSEALHGAARSGLATVFPQAIGMAASFDPELLQEVMDIASTEQRIKYIQARRAGLVKRYSGLTVWTPNINIFRDPRWGRGQETYGEDPFLTRKMGYAVVTGLQGKPNEKVYKFAGEGKWRPYDKLHACLKHYAIHSGPEYERHKFNVTDLSQRDLVETYLYAFENLVKTTDVHEVMCAYNAYEGKPCCGSDQLLTQILRKEWGYKGIVVSDCGAINDFYSPRYENHRVFENAAASSANAVLSGTDVECGSAYSSLPEAVKSGAIKEEDIDVSVLRLLTDRFRLGEMDSDEIVSWNYIPESFLANEESDQKALQMARESMVLLKNDGNLLPLSGKKIAVIGANATDSVAQWGNYYGSPRRTVTVLDAMRQIFGPANIIYKRGSSLVTDDVFESAFSQCAGLNGQKGFTVKYWNNLKKEGEPVVVQDLTSPWQLCTGGNTVFAPGVNLRDFSAEYVATFHADKNQQIVLDGFICGQGCYLVNGDTVQTFRTGHGPRPFNKTIDVEAGKDYHIVIDWMYIADDAQINFDLGVFNPIDYDKLVADTQDADVYVYVGGISPKLEGEEMKVPYEGFRGGDRTSIQLPSVQRETLKKLHETGKPVVFVCMSGSAIGLEPETSTCDAILQAWYGGQQGGQAVADVLSGAYNPAGRLPITFYRSEEELPDFGDYNMKGHTYRYFKGEPLFAFGEGMSYSTFEYGNTRLRRTTASVDGEPTRISYSLIVPVTNTSQRDGEEVIQVYLKKENDEDGPLRSLRGFKRIEIKAGETVDVEIPIEDLRTYNPETCKMEIVPGSYTLYYGPSSRLKDLHPINFNLREEL
ncbi:MAG: glycoside hydrolase family 3 C-terminal domain-containing protein [Bacteroidales bacterium]|nr:glycoside hydrolase family 3 C-terminal domain-containing protein [Bacteroidales bacterium]